MCHFTILEYNKQRCCVSAGPSEEGQGFPAYEECWVSLPITSKIWLGIWDSIFGFTFSSRNINLLITSQLGRTSAWLSLGWWMTSWGWCCKAGCWALPPPGTRLKPFESQMDCTHRQLRSYSILTFYGCFSFSLCLVLVIQVLWAFPLQVTMVTWTC